MDQLLNGHFVELLDQLMCLAGVEEHCEVVRHVVGGLQIDGIRISADVLQFRKAYNALYLLTQHIRVEANVVQGNVKLTLSRDLVLHISTIKQQVSFIFKY